ncbi:MAG: hypothetical protein B0W54_19215 [Cellvibrio sp. 79]|nr:MAG: hypothetical protein B0W54_19215 [Cellvibrio sp. 79]
MGGHCAFSDCLESLPFITIIIPVFNEEEYIGETLDQLEKQIYPQHLMEIFLIDGGSTDKTIHVIAKWCENSGLTIKVISNVNRISSTARNIGINSAQGEYILFIDAHVFIPSNDLIRNMANSARTMNAMVLGRAQPLTPPELNDFQTIVAGVRGSLLGHSTKSYIYSDHEGWVSPVSIGVMYHHSIFENSERFDEFFDAAEDVEFNYRLESKGYKAFLSPDFKISYYPRKNLSGLFKQMFRYGLGRARFTNKHFKGFQWEIFMPVAALFSLLIVGSLAFNKDTFFAFLVLTATGYSLLIIYFLGVFFKTRHLLLSPFFLLLVHIGLACGLLAGLIEGVSIKLANMKGFFYERN